MSIWCWPGLLSSSSSSPSVSSPSTTAGGPAVSASSSPMKDTSTPASSQPRPVRRAPQGPQALMPLPCKKAEGLQYNNFKCLECQIQFASKAELVTHFQQIRGAPNSVSLLLFAASTCWYKILRLIVLHCYCLSDVYTVLTSHDAAQPMCRVCPSEDP